ncbi:MAG: hypothetical protein HY917_01225, partial [Candidatus Diapherotrites archaeon]|nr:hypothetical protein [Candidatus Diapherotrites archaeon]
MKFITFPGILLLIGILISGCTQANTEPAPASTPALNEAPKTEIVSPPANSLSAGCVISPPQAFFEGNQITGISGAGLYGGQSLSLRMNGASFLGVCTATCRNYEASMTLLSAGGEEIATRPVHAGDILNDV